MSEQKSIILIFVFEKHLYEYARYCISTYYLLLHWYKYDESGMPMWSFSLSFAVGLTTTNLV